MHYLIISFSYKNSAIDIREKLSFSQEEQLDCLEKLNSSSSVNESILISTCNRMEIFVSCSSVMSATQHIFMLINKRTNIAIEELEGRADIFDDQGAIHHLFSVASSLDSLIVGETQITGQLKDAFRTSFDYGMCGQKLSRAMHFAFKCAAEVRNGTNISVRPVSIASVAVATLQNALPKLYGKKALVVGVGEMSEITIKHLIAHNVKVYLTNRTYEHAIKLASRYEIEVIEFEHFLSVFNDFEIIFTATSSSEALITDKDIKECPYKRFWFDMAVPRDINCQKLKNIRLFHIDDLKSIVDNNIHKREDEAQVSYRIIGRKTMEFYEWLKTLSIEPIIKHLYLKAEYAAVAETSRVIDKKYIPKEYRRELLKMNRQVLKRFLHDFTCRLREISYQSDADTIIESMKYLLNEDDAVLLNEYKCEHMLKG